MKTAKLTVVLTAILVFSMVFTACPNGNNDEPKKCTCPNGTVHFTDYQNPCCDGEGCTCTFVQFDVSFMGTPKWGEGRKLEAVVYTQLQGTPYFVWTGIAGTNPGYSYYYTMVEDDENNTITCTVTIDGKSKSASVTIMPMYPDLDISPQFVVENRSTSKSDADITGVLFDGESVGGSNRTTVFLVTSAVENAKANSATVVSKLETYPLKKIIITESGTNVTYSKGKLEIPYTIIWDGLNSTYSDVRDIIRPLVITAIEAVTD